MHEDNIEETITYVPLGKIIPDAMDNEVPTFQRQPSTMPITQLKVGELVPHIPGYRPMQQSVMPENLTGDILVEYAPNP